MEFDRIARLAGNHFIYGTKGSFHYAAGGTEDMTCTGSDTKERIKLFIRKIGEQQACLADHSSQFSGGQRNVDVRQSVFGKLLSANLKLLRRTRHDGYDDDVLRIDTVLFRIVGTNHGTEHALRALAGGQVFNHVRIIGFTEFYPAW